MSLKLLRENVLQADFELVQNRFQFVQGQMMLAPFNPVQGRMRYADPFAELKVRHLPSRLSQEFRQLSIEVAPHRKNLAKFP